MGGSLPAVAVVMSTYNGARFLREQIESILSQEGVSVSLFVRDDGSRDATLDVLRGYERQGKLTLFAEKNVGVVASFLDGIARVPSEFSLIALSDQDDVWHPDKLLRAVEVLGEKDPSVPQLYCSEYLFCDEGLTPIGRSHLNLRGVDFRTLLYEVRVSGNTTVINRALADLAIEGGASGVYGHDWWLALLAAALGELTFDDFVSLDYRRTSDNVSPTGASPIALLRFRVRKFLNRDELGKITGQLEKLRDLYGDRIDPGKRATLERFLGGGRIAKALAPMRLRQQLGEEVALRLLFLLGLL